eukprot:jgi/Bigna1/53135/estExt_Genewise1Plus.C_160016
MRDKMLKLSARKNWNAALYVPIILDYLPSDLVLENDHPGIVKAVTFSSDGKFVASASYCENNVRVWNAFDGKQILELKGHTSVVNSIAFSPRQDSYHIASGSDDGTTRMWDSISGKEEDRFDRSDNSSLPCCCLAVSICPNGYFVASGYDDGGVLLWNAMTKNTGVTPLIVLDSGDSIRLEAVAFSDDGEYIASAWNGIILISDTITGQKLHEFKARTNIVRSLAFFPGGDYLVSAGDREGTIQIWRPPKGDLVLELRGHCGAVTSVTLSMDGRFRLASASCDKTVRVWEVQHRIMMKR